MIVHEYAHWWLFLLFLPLELLVFVRVIRPVYPKFKFLVWRCARILYCLRKALDYNNNERGTSQEGRPGTRFSKKKYIYTHTHCTNTPSVVPLCVVKGEKQSFEGQGSVPPRGCPIFFNPDDLDVFGYSLNSGLPDERVSLMKWLTIIRCRCVSSYGL